LSSPAILVQDAGAVNRCLVAPALVAAVRAHDHGGCARTRCHSTWSWPPPPFAPLQGGRVAWARACLWKRGENLRPVRRDAERCDEVQRGCCTRCCTAQPQAVTETRESPDSSSSPRRGAGIPYVSSDSSVRVLPNATKSRAVGARVGAHPATKASGLGGRGRHRGTHRQPAYGFSLPDGLGRWRAAHRFPRRPHAGHRNGCQPAERPPSSGGGEREALLVRES
jgi:hypothetical protein